MIKRVLVLFLALGFAAASYADDGASGSNETGTPAHSGSSSDRFFRRVIVQGSLVNAGYEGGDASRYSQPNGWSAGATFDLIGFEKLVLETGALYRQLGTTVQNGFGNNSVTANYISVPLDMKYYFSGQEVTSFFIKGGVMGSTLISHNNYYATPTTQIGARQWETAVLGGVGFKFNMSDATDFLIEADYNRALDSLFAGSKVYRSDFSGMLGIGVNL